MRQNMTNAQIRAQRDDMIVRQANRWWTPAKVLCVVYALALLFIGLFPDTIQRPGAAVALFVLTIAMQLAIAVPIVKLIIQKAKR